MAYSLPDEYVTPTIANLKIQDFVTAKPVSNVLTNNYINADATGQSSFSELLRFWGTGLFTPIFPHFNYTIYNSNVNLLLWVGRIPDFLELEI